MNNQAKVVVINNQPDNAKEMEQLAARLKQLKQDQKKCIKFTVEEFKHRKTGETMRGINIHGITARPIFLYGSQAEAFVQIAPQLTEFVESVRSQLTWKKEE